MPQPSDDLTDGPTDRTTVLMSLLNKDMNIVEIGPSYHPIAAKRDGWRTTIVDYSDRAGLVSVYDRHSVEAVAIEEVDVVWSAGQISDAFPVNLLGTFDVVIASHVIEHSPDIVGFLLSCDRLLKRTGFVLLVVPDKRECFDFFKPVSTSADAMEAFVQQRTRHSAKTHFTHIASAVTTDHGIAWGVQIPAGLRLVHRLHQAKDAYDTISDHPDSPYLDCHAWVFTPASFELLVLDLRHLGLTSLAVDIPPCKLPSEFIVTLRPAASPLSDPEMLARSRCNLMYRQLIENRDQIERLLQAD